MVLEEWLSLFPNATLDNLIASISDHTHILLNCEIQVRPCFKRSFKFENSWLVEPDIVEVVEHGWLKEEQDSILARLDGCVEELAKLGRGLRNRFREDIEKTKKELEVLHRCNDEASTEEYNATRYRSTHLLIQEDIFWKQRAMIHWLKDGDSNYKFFHIMASARKKKNTMVKLQCEDGRELSSQTDLQDTVKGYFEGLFTASNAQYDLVTNSMR